jgi:hypothetical protein
MVFLAIQMVFSGNLSAIGKVYLVLGSDTAIWDGMDVARYNCYYNPALYTDPVRNAYGVMDPSWRNQFVDSFGQPMKLTWWMMAGSIFNPGSNTNVPFANVITMYLMKKYHGENVRLLGDELSLHYHTFKWTDYDGDGKFWWNQSLSFEECSEDFDFTLAQLLIEEEVFPVSFRSGWHYMDNGWQQRLDELLPYSLHNDWPNQRVDTEEPLDNTFDWSVAPGQFVPYRPSPANYQLPGDGPGWNVRSTHLFTARYRDLIDSLFARAYNGADQLACLWGHLPETDFLTNLEIIDSLAHRMSNKYPGVTIRYCTAIEAMQRWRGLTDTIPPVLTFEKIESGDQVYFRISTNEDIFQAQPLVAVKNIYEDYQTLNCYMTGVNAWETSEPMEKSFLARAAVAVCDTMGNQSLAFIDFRPKDLYVDNEDQGFSEIRGNWQTVSADVWGTDYRETTIAIGDSAKVRWSPALAVDGLYNIEIRFPAISTAAEDLTFRVIENAVGIDTVHFNAALPAEVWNHITTVNLNAGSDVYLEMISRSNNAGMAAADVVKFSALVRDRDIRLGTDFLDFGEVIVNDSAWQTLTIENSGIQPLTISAVSSVYGGSGVGQALPLVIPANGRVNLDIFVFPSEIGAFSDTLRIVSDDPVKPELRLPVAADVQNFFRILDNEDSLNYAEHGTWYYSNAQAYGPSSRYAFLNNGAYATFTVSLEISGTYDIYEIVPTTQNAANHALYRISAGGVLLDSLFVDQNAGSGDWVLLGRYLLPENTPVEVRVIDAGGHTAGAVLRADAIKFALAEEISGIAEENWPTLPKHFEFDQNYPNPFNATTHFRYALIKPVDVTLQVFNSLGQLVTTLVDEPQSPGYYDYDWQGEAIASGVYFARFQAGTFVKTRKLMLLK